MYLQHHDGECRVWDLGPEKRIPFVIGASDADAAASGGSGPDAAASCASGPDAAASGASGCPCDLNAMGEGYGGTWQSKTRALRKNYFEDSDGIGPPGQERRLVMEFGFATPEKCPMTLPDLDNAISTTMVYGVEGSIVKYWLRQVKVITLAEVFDNWQEDADWPVPYCAWCEGECVIRPKLRRGSSAGRSNGNSGDGTWNQKQRRGTKRSHSSSGYWWYKRQAPW